MSSKSIPQPPENTHFIKELQWKENKSQDEFLGSLLQDGNMAKDHIAVRSNSSSSSNTKGNARELGKNGSSSSDKYDMHTQLSMNLWKRVNAGYLVPARPPIGVNKSAYTYDKTQIEKKSFEFHRKRDFYSEYNEAAARFKLVHGNKKPLSRKKETGKEGKGKKSNETPGIESASLEQSSPWLPTMATNETVVTNEADNSANNNKKNNGNTIDSK